MTGTGPGCDTGGGGGGGGGTGVFLARPGTKAGPGSAVLRCRLSNTKTEGCVVQSDWDLCPLEIVKLSQPPRLHAANTQCDTAGRHQIVSDHLRPGASVEEDRTRGRRVASEAKPQTVYRQQGW